MRRCLPLLCVALFCLTALHAADSPEDPWSGKTRADAVALLGEPNKTKTIGDDETILIYKLVRLEDGAIPPAGMRVLNVPGLGVVAQVLPDALDYGGKVTINPTEMDDKGHVTAGGAATEETLSMSWDTEDKELTRSWQDKPAVRGKATLKLHVNAKGEILDWSVSPKKAAAGR